MVDQVVDFFRTTDKVKTQEVVKSRGQPCGDIDLTAYLAYEAYPVHFWITGLFTTELSGYIVNLSDYFSCRLIEKLATFLQIQEFSQRNPTVTSSTSSARLSFSRSKAV